MFTSRQRTIHCTSIQSVSGRTVRLFMALALSVLVLAVVQPRSVQAMEFGPGLQNTEWQVDCDIFECEFRQSIPFYGDAVFYHRAGEEVRFFLETPSNRMQDGRAALAVEAPSWRPSSQVRDLGYVTVRHGERPLEVDTERTLSMLAALESGMSPAFTRQGRGMTEPIRVKLSPVGFNRYFQEYRAGITQLLPVNFDQVERTRIQYDTGVDSLDRSAQATLNDVITYVLNDPNIVAVYVEGHADNQSTRYDARRRSERRALQVRDYMVERGVEPNMILVDYHGSQFPVASNDTAEGRAQNRRTTVRLERVDLSAFQ